MCIGSLVMAVLVTKQEQHSRCTTNKMPVMPRSLRDRPARKRKLIVDIEDEEEYEENIELLPTEPGDLSNQRVSVIKEVPKAKRSRSISRRIRTQRVEEDAKAKSSHSDKFVSSKMTWRPLSFGELKYDSLDEEGEGRYRSLRKLSEKEGTMKHRMTDVETKGFLEKRLSGKVCKMLNEKKVCGNKLKKKKGESESEEEWVDHKEKHRGLVDLSSNQEKPENVNCQRTSKRRCVSSNKLLDKNFIFCDWVDDEEDLASIIETGMGGNDSIDASRIQSSDDTTKTERSLCAKRKCGDSAKQYLSNLPSSPSSSSSSSSLSISKLDVKTVKRSGVENLKVVF